MFQWIPPVGAVTSTLVAWEAIIALSFLVVIFIVQVVRNKSGICCFYWRCIKLTGKGVLGVVGDFGVLFAIGLAWVVSQHPEWLADKETWATVNAFGGWIIPIGLLASISIARLILAPFWVYEETRRERDALVRGDLRLSVLHFDYNRSSEKLEAQLMFSNDDALSQRTIIGVNFIYRASSSDSGFEVYHTGTMDAFFIGHIDPIRLPPRAEEIQKYEAPVPRSKFDIIGAQAGLNITFSVPARPTDNANVIAMEIVESNLTNPARNYPHIERLSLDSISMARQLESMLGMAT